jgi:iron(III) transport system permease protein
MLYATVGSNPPRSYVGMVLDSRQRGLLANTVALGLGTLAITTGIGVPLGIALGRCDVRRVVWTRVVLVLPLVLPTYVLALVWVLVAPLVAGFRAYGLIAAALVLGFSYYPVVMLATEASLRQLSSRLEDAARLVASPPRVWVGVLLPLMLPTLSASGLIVFVLAISDFAVPALLRARVHTTEVFTAFAALYDFRRATLMALPLVVVATIASIASLELWRRPVVGRAEHAPSALTWSNATQRIALRILAGIAVAFLGLPTGALVIHAVSGRTSLAEALSGGAIANSFLWSFIGSFLIVSAGAVLGYARVRASSHLAYVADALLVTVFAVPATVLGIGVISVWNRPGWAGDIYRSDAIVIIAYLGRFLPLATLLCAAFLRQVPRGVEEAAFVSGASWLSSLRHVVFPMAAKSLFASWLIIFILIFGEVAITILVAPPGESTIPVRAYTLIANAPSVDVARLALLQIAVSALPIGVVALLFRHGGVRPA